MSGVLVLFAFLTLALLILVPTAARAGQLPKAPSASMVERYQPIYVKYGSISGEILNKGGSFDKHKLSSSECAGLVVVAHKSSDMSGPIVGKTNATLNGDGKCVYSLKVPADPNVTIGVESFSWGASNVSSSEYLKLKPEDKWAPYKKLANGDWIKSALKGEGSFQKIVWEKHKGKIEIDSLSMPLYVTLTPGQ
jgi:hypothetical protein